MEQLIYSNDFSAACQKDAEYAVHHPDTLMAVLSWDDGHVSHISDFLQYAGVSAKEADSLEDRLLDDKSSWIQKCQLLSETLAQQKPTLAQEKAMTDFLASCMQQSDEYMQAYENSVSNRMEDALSELCISEDEPYLAIRQGKESTVDYIEPSMDLARDLQNGLSGVSGNDLRISYRKGTNALTATFSFLDHPGWESETFAVIPKSWAKEAYASKEFHEALSNAISDPDVADFLREAQALPEVEKDPLTFGTLRAIYTMQDDMPDDIQENFYRCLADFRMEDFQKFCKESNFYIQKHLDAIQTPTDAYAVENEIYGRVEPFFFDAIYEQEPAKETTLSKGIRTVMKENPSFDKTCEKLGGFLKGDQKAIQALQKLGKPQEPAR